LEGILKGNGLDAAFHRLADERWARSLADGKTIPWDEAKSCLEAKARGEDVEKPAARQFKV
jgi:hypothetical protein